MAEQIEVAGLVTKIAVDDTMFEKSMAELQRQMKLVESEFKKASSGLDQFGQGTEGLKLKADSLSKQLELQGAVVAKLNEQYQKSAEEKGKDAIETQKLETRLNNAVAKYNQLESQLRQTNQELAVQSSRWTQLGQSMQKAGDRLQKIGRGLESAGKSLTVGLTAPLTAIGGLATKASIDFESAFAGVRKTVDATEEEFAVLSEGIRKMAREDVPVAATEIAKVAEAAGQLGIQKDAILGFTRTMIDLGVATNLTGDQAATALARLANITQMNQQDFDRLGATIVELGNNLATTEAEIVEMALRLAGAGKQIGLTEAQILAFAGSLSSVGIAAEAGGSAFSKLMITIANEVATAGEKLSQFAAVAGMSASQFQKAFQEDAAGAIISFIEGLDGIARSGGNVFGVLEELGLTEIRLRDAILRAAGAGDLFRESIELGSRAWDENLALTKEAEQRYATSASQLQMLKNRLADVGITLGDALVPALLDVLKAMEPLFRAIENGARWFSELDTGTQRTIIAISALVAALGPTIVVIGKLVTSIGSIVTALGSMSAAIGAAGGAAAVFSKGIAAIAGPIGIAIASIGLLTTAVIQLKRTFSADAIPAVQTFESQAAASLERASGSFAKFRQDAQADLKQTAQVAKTEGAVIGENVAKGVTSGTSKAKDQAIADMREMVERMKETVDRNTSSLNRLGDAITTALKRQYEEMERAQIAALEKQIENERKASDERIRIYDAEYAEKLKLIDEEAYLQIKAIQDQIDAIDKLTEAEERARREEEYRNRIAEYQRRLAEATSAEERAKIQQEMAKMVADYERQLILEQRKAQKEALREQIEEIKAAANERKEQLKRELEEKKAAEKDFLQATLDRLNDEKDAVKAHFNELTETEALQAEARKLIVEQNNEEIVRLLETYNPKWQDAGQSFADAFKEGLNSEKQSIEEAVREIVDIAPVIDDQVRELDRLQSKLKELEATTKGSAGSAGKIGGSILAPLAMDLEEAIIGAEELTNVFTDKLTPAIAETGEATTQMSEDSLAAFIGLRDQATVALNELYWSGREITEETAETIADTFFAMGNEILENLEASHAKQIQSMQRFFDNTSELTNEEKEKMMQNLLEAQAREREEIERSQQRIFEILSKALEEQRKLTKEEYDEINRIQREFTKTAEDIFKDYELTQKALIERMRADASEITALQAAEVVRNSLEQRDGAIKAAEEQYENVLKEIIRQRDDVGSISAEQADRLILEAKRQRDEAIRYAEETHRRVVEEARKQAGEHHRLVDWETGEVLKTWQAYGIHLEETWDEIIAGFRKKDKEMHDVGRGLMQGFWNGIKSMDETIRTGARNIGNMLVNELKDVLKIRSPSRVMMGIGEDTAEGFLEGLKNKIEAIRLQAKSIAQAAMPGMRSIEAQAGGQLAVGGGSRSTNVQNIYNFERMFEGANFSVRDEADIRNLAHEIGEYILSKGRG